MSNLKGLSRRALFFSLSLFGSVAASWRLGERQKVVELISALKEPKCPAMVVVLDSSVRPGDADANEFLLDRLVDEYPYPLTLLETSPDGGGALDVGSGPGSNRREPVCSNVVIVSDRASKLRSLHRQVNDLYYVRTALVVLTQGRARDIDAVLLDAKSEHLLGVLERPGRVVEVRFWTVSDAVRSTVLRPFQGVDAKDLLGFKGNDLSGRRLKVAAIDCRPAVIIDEKTSMISGVEPSLVQLMSEHLGFTYDYVQALPNEMWGDVVILDNGTSSLTGLLGILGRKEADLAVGNFYLLLKRKEFIDYSAVYKFSYESFLVPAPQPYPKWTAIFYPFTLATWAATAASAAMIAAMLRFVAGRQEPLLTSRRGNDAFASLQFCCLYVVGNLLNVQMQPQNILSNANRTFLICWLFGTLILTTGYRSGLISHMTFPFTPPPIDTFQQLVDSRLMKTSFGEFMKDNLLNATSETERILGKEIVASYNFTAMFVQVESGLWAVESNVENILYMAATMYPTTAAGPRVHLMRDSIMPSGVALGLQKDSQLKPYVDREIQRFIETGLVDYHRLQVAGRMDKWPPKKASRSDDLISFSLNNLQGAFILFVVGVLISAMVFAAELASNRKEMRRIANSGNH